MFYFLLYICELQIFFYQNDENEQKIKKNKKNLIQAAFAGRSLEPTHSESQISVYMRDFNMENRLKEKKNTIL